MTIRQDLLKRDFEALKFQASVLYIKDGISAKEICRHLELAMPTLSKWIKAGRWQELRPDLSILNQYKAAGLYIDQGKSTGEISQLTSVSETIIKLWIDINGWEAARLVKQSKNIHIDIVSNFCDYAKGKFPNDTALIQTAQQLYFKTIL